MTLLRSADCKTSARKKAIKLKAYRGGRSAEALGKARLLVYAHYHMSVFFQLIEPSAQLLCVWCVRRDHWSGYVIDVLKHTIHHFDSVHYVGGFGGPLHDKDDDKKVQE